MLRRAVISSIIQNSIQSVLSYVKTNDIVGEVYNVDFSNDSQYTSNLTNTTKVGNMITVNTPNYTDSYTYNQFSTNSDNYHIEHNYTINSLDCISGIYIRSNIHWQSMAYAITYNCTNGKLEIIRVFDGSIWVESTETITPSLGGNVKVEFIRNATSLTAIVTHNGQTITRSFTYFDVGISGAENYRQIGTACFQGVFTITDLKFNVNSYIDYDFIFFGDSITTGLVVTAEENRFVDRLAIANPSLRFLNLSGPSNKIEHYDIQEFDKYNKNAKIILCIGTNNAQGTQILFETKYQQLLSDLVSLGFTQIYISLMIPRQVAPNIIPYNELLKTYGYPYIDNFTSMSIDGVTNQLKPEYNIDGTHPSNAGNLQMSQNIAQAVNINIPS